MACDTGVRCGCSSDAECVSVLGSDTGKAVCVMSTGECECAENWTGPRCDVASLGMCEGGVIDSAGSCCAGLVDATTGRCCVSGSSVDKEGRCCEGVVDTCGVCEGGGKGVSVEGECCHHDMSAAGMCCDVEVDVCGVCGGTNDCVVKSMFGTDLDAESGQKLSDRLSSGEVDVLSSLLGMLGIEDAVNVGVSIVVGVDGKVSERVLWGWGLGDVMGAGRGGGREVMGCCCVGVGSCAGGLYCLTQALVELRYVRLSVSVGVVVSVCRV